MRKINLIFALLMLSITLSWAQENKKGLTLLHLSSGVSLSNFINSEAPHNINTYGSYQYVGLSGVSTLPAYFDYKTNWLKDIKVGLVLGIGIEYFLKNDLSLAISVNYESKGINLTYNKHESRTVSFPIVPGSLTPPPPSNTVYYDENFDVNITNNYLTVPILLRKYITKKGLYAQGGGYIGYLVNSQISTYQQKHLYIPNYAFYGYNAETWIDKKMDQEKEFTNTIDYGISFGTGFSHKLTDQLFFNADLLINIGLRKIDKKYNNEYDEKLQSIDIGFVNKVRSTNYFGLNSNAKNINASITVGLAYKL